MSEVYWIAAFPEELWKAVVSFQLCVYNSLVLNWEALTRDTKGNVGISEQETGVDGGPLLHSREAPLSHYPPDGGHLLQQEVYGCVTLPPLVGWSWTFHYKNCIQTMLLRCCQLGIQCWTDLVSPLCCWQVSLHTLSQGLIFPLQETRLQGKWDEHCFVGKGVQTALF